MITTGTVSQYQMTEMNSKSGSTKRSPSNGDSTTTQVNGKKPFRGWVGLTHYKSDRSLQPAYKIDNNDQITIFHAPETTDLPRSTK